MGNLWTKKPLDLYSLLLQTILFPAPIARLVQDFCLDRSLITITLNELKARDFPPEHVKVCLFLRNLESLLVTRETLFLPGAPFQDFTSALSGRFLFPPSESTRSRFSATPPDLVIVATLSDISAGWDSQKFLAEIPSSFALEEALQQPILLPKVWGKSHITLCLQHATVLNANTSLEMLGRLLKRLSANSATTHCKWGKLELATDDTLPPRKWPLAWSEEDFNQVRLIPFPLMLTQKQEEHHELTRFQ